MVARSWSRSHVSDDTDTATKERWAYLFSATLTGWSFYLDSD